jgi:hypothetical protein
MEQKPHPRIWDSTWAEPYEGWPDLSIGSTWTRAFSMRNLLVALLIGTAWASPALSQDKAQTSGYSAMNGYYGNTMVFWTPAGKIQALIYYNPDFTYQEWRRGEWKHGTYVLNNDQDSSTLCLTRMQDNLPITNCHSFESDKVVGDKWTKSPAPYEKHKPNNETASYALEKGHVAPPTK